jgi:hypothetical protein
VAKDLANETGGEAAPGPGPGVGLSSLRTSVNCTESLWHATERARINALEPMAERLERRGLDRAATGEMSRAAWALSRARGLRGELAPRLERCGTRAKVLRCRCATVAVWYRCGRWEVCQTCQRIRSRRQSARIAAGLHGALERERERWRRAGCRRDARPRLYLATFSVRHGSSIEETAERLERAWRAFYKRAHLEGWALAYASVLEVTAGRDGQGHPHLHVALVAPYLPYGQLRAAWRRATGDDEAQLDLAANRRDGRPSSASSAARYLGKYLGKGVQVSEMTPELAGRTLAMLWGRRTVRSSRGFWAPWERPPCQCCGQVPDPEPLRTASRFRWQAPVERMVAALRVPRGTPANVS